nr:PREDICTED: phospholipase A1-like [Megachile rotundata]
MMDPVLFIAYLRSGLDYNVIVMDWRYPAKGLYTIVARGVPQVATQLARFILFMKSSWNLNTLSTTLVGHSLGAHVVSLAAKGVLESSPIARVVGLDPAKPMFQNRGSNCRLDKSHAKYVEVLHTSKFFLGMSTAVGTVDFFANNGLHQPGCNIFVTNSCSHQRAFAYFSESIMKPTRFRAQARNGVIAYMGGPDFNKSARGIFYFKTNSRSPYGRG